MAIYPLLSEGCHFPRYFASDLIQGGFVLRTMTCSGICSRTSNTFTIQDRTSRPLLLLKIRRPNRAVGSK